MSLSPPIDKSLDSLAPMFRAPFEAWLKEAQSILTHVDIKVTETRRTLARQEWLYAQGREEPFLGAPQLTWTLDSNHRWGLAVDLAMIRKETGEAIWEISSWKWLYHVAPLNRYGLATLAPLEWAHVEYFWAAKAASSAKTLGLVQT